MTKTEANKEYKIGNLRICVVITKKDKGVKFDEAFAYARKHQAVQSSGNTLMYLVKINDGPQQLLTGDQLASAILKL